MNKQISKTVLATILREDKLIFAEMEVKENKRLIKAEFEIMPAKESVLEKILHEMKTMKVEINARFDEVNARIDETNARIDDLSNDFNNRFDKLETRVEALDKRVTVLEEKAK